MSHYIDLLDLQTPTHLRSELEHRTQFDLGAFEVNIFETYQPSTQVRIQYEGLSISSMIRGRKIVYDQQGQTREFLPGTSLLLSENETIYADFPQASLQNPVQCATILINKDTLAKKLEFLNTYYPNKNQAWKLELGQFLFKNNAAWVRAVNELLQLALNDRENTTLADLLLKSLLVRMLSEQRVQNDNQNPIITDDRLHLVKQFIQSNLEKPIKNEDLSKVANCSSSSIYRMFEEHCQMSPGAYILQRRLNKAQNLLLQPNLNISEVCFQSGFNTVSYFVKQFKAHVNCTPKEFSKKFRIQ